MYVVNSPELIAAIQKQPRTISFAPLEAKLIERLFCPTAKGAKIMNANPDGTNGEEGLYAKGIKAIHAALLPGDSLDAMNRIAIHDIAASCDELAPGMVDGTPVPVRIELMRWIRHELTMASTNAVYGPMNPFNDPRVEDSWW